MTLPVRMAAKRPSARAASTSRNISTFARDPIDSSGRFRSKLFFPICLFLLLWLVVFFSGTALEGVSDLSAPKNSTSIELRDYVNTPSKSTMNILDKAEETLDGEEINDSFVAEPPASPSPETLQPKPDNEGSPSEDSQIGEAEKTSAVEEPNNSPENGSSQEINANSLNSEVADSETNGIFSSQSKAEAVSTTDHNITEADYNIHVAFDDLNYRRVCAPVHSSHLCLTIRYPFPLEEQDASVHYAKPVQTKFYEKEIEVHFIDGEEFDQCKDGSSDSINSAKVKACIDYYHEKATDPDAMATAIWTRTRGIKTAFFGVTSEDQRARANRFFARNVLLVLGAPTSRFTAMDLREIFYRCKAIDSWNGMSRGAKVEGAKSPGRGQNVCYGEGANAAANSADWDGLVDTEDWSVILVQGFHPNAIGHGFYNHTITPGTTLVGELENVLALSNRTSLKISVIIDHPLTHTQNHELITQSFNHVTALQNGWTEVILNSTSAEGRASLAARGLEISNLIVFDGTPQFFPTDTGSYSGMFRSFENETQFLEQGGYNGWKEDYGSRCRGFLPPNSKLTEVNRLGRSAYERNGLDMRFYGRIWEFVNMVWFSTRGTIAWGTGGPDCSSGTYTHSMHKYFVMAMVEDELDKDRL